MRYLFVAATLFAAAVVADPGMVYEIPDGQIQASSTVVKEATVYSTDEVTITSCHPTVKNCPAHSSTSKIPMIVTPVSVSSSVTVSVPTSISTSAVDTSVVTSVPASSAPASSLSVSSVPVYTVPQPSAPVPSVSVPVPSISSSPPFPSGTAPAVSACPVCPSATNTCAPPVTIYSTVTVSPSGVPTPATESPFSPIEETTIPTIPIPAPTATSVPAPPPVSTSPTTEEEGPEEETPEGSDVPVQTLPVPVPSPAPAPSGTAPGAPSGFITGPKPTGSPIAFTGSASAISSSLVVAGVAALAVLGFSA